MRRRATGHLLAGVVIGWVALQPALALAQGAPGGTEAPHPRASRQQPVAQKETFATWHARRGLNLRRTWGIDIVGVRRVASGSMLRFDYRVLAPDRAEALTDRKVRPFVIDEATQTALAVPAMENIGELRQVAPLEASRTYYVIFGNPGGLVKRGGRVTIVIGNFRAEGVVVD